MSTHKPSITLIIVVASIKHSYQCVVAEGVREFWIHKPTGRVWAVELRDGVVIAAAGPLDIADAEPMLLDHLDYSRYEAAWIKKKLNDFVRIERERAR